MAVELRQCTRSRALSVKKFLNSKKITGLEHPPYSPDLASCDFFFIFPTVKSCLKGIHFTSVEEVKAKTENLLKVLLKTSFQKCYQQWQHRMQKCVNAEGNYFKGATVTEN
ncbi:uncharacterized protein TNCV_1458281 [Trichonephila clavipes]|nr:uncharacterized protein TNCV_1458281 [Trichonephila clavipes]